MRAAVPTLQVKSQISELTHGDVSAGKGATSAIVTALEFDCSRSTTAALPQQCEMNRVISPEAWRTYQFAQYPYHSRATTGDWACHRTMKAMANVVSAIDTQFAY